MQSMFYCIPCILKLCLRFSRRKDKVEKAGILVFYFGGHFEGLEVKRLVNNVL